MHRLEKVGDVTYVRRYQRWLDWIIPTRVGVVCHEEWLTVSGLQLQVLRFVDDRPWRTRQDTYLLSDGQLIGPFDQGAFDRDDQYALEIGRETLAQRDFERHVEDCAELDRQADIEYAEVLTEREDDRQRDLDRTYREEVLGESDDDYLDPPTGKYDWEDNLDLAQLSAENAAAIKCRWQARDEDSFNEEARQDEEDERRYLESIQDEVCDEDGDTNDGFPDDDFPVDDGGLPDFDDDDDYDIEDPEVEEAALQRRLAEAAGENLLHYGGSPPNDDHHYLG